MKKTVSFSKNAVNLFFHILTQCNLTCRHCYINPPQHGSHRLDLATMIKWLRAIYDPAKTTNVVFLGGEPTLHPQLPEAVHAARAMGYSSITIDTNGYLFHDILSKIDPESVDYISFSLDGATRETNDRLRGDGVFDTGISAIRRTIRKGFHTSLIYTVSQANIHELAQMPDLLFDLGIHRFFIQVLGVRGSAQSKTKDGNKGLVQVPQSAWLETIPQVADAAARKGVIVSYPKVFLEPEAPFECAGLVAENFFVFPNGRVYRCPLCEDYPLNALMFAADKMVRTQKINETDLFSLSIPEGCVMNKLIQPENLVYHPDGSPLYKIACCMLKEEVSF
ncbi:MAG: radical SAM protein [Deltaproteobacteria bacterium]|nr:radical SAM protein [Deltaproteobacteria bacterium]